MEGASIMDTTGICFIEDTAIAGTNHVDNIHEIAQELGRGAPLSFEHDSHNPFDPWAVKVFDDRHRRLGYVSCAHNEVVARLMDGGKRVAGRLRRVANVEAWTRIEMGVYLYD